MSKFNDDEAGNGDGRLYGDGPFESGLTPAIQGGAFTLQRAGRAAAGDAVHEHARVEVGILFEPGAGVLSCWHDGELREHPLVAPIAYVIPPKLRHVMRWETPSELFVGHIEPRFWRNIAPDIPIEGVTAGAIAAAKTDLVLWEFATLLRHLWDEGESQERSAKWSAYSLLARAARLISPTKPSSDDSGCGLSPSRRQAMDAYIEKQIRFNLHAPDLAKIVGLSVPYFSTVLKRDTGMTPHEYLTRFRMLRAFQLLVTGDHCLGEVAAAVGYDDPVHFSRRFRRFFNYPPRVLMLRSRGRYSNRQGKP